MNEPLNIYVGFDPGEAVAYAVCVNSLIRHSSQPLRIMPLALNTLGGIYKEQHSDGSTEFAYSRFLVPYLSGFVGNSLFIDGDMIVRDDIAKLFDLPRFDMHSSVWCVKHAEYAPKGATKFRGAKQRPYAKKNWSSVMLFRNSASFCKQLTPDYVSQATGAHLHQFEWLPDTRVGEIPRTWNWLVGEDAYKRNDDAKLIHYTQGIPAFSAYQQCDMAEYWWDEFHRLTHVDE